MVGAVGAILASAIMMIEEYHRFRPDRCSILSILSTDTYVG